MTAPLDKAKFNVIRREYMKGHFNHVWMEGQLHISKNTVTKYVKECREIEQRYLNRLKDFSFRLPKTKMIRPRTKQYTDLINMFPPLIDAVTRERGCGRCIYGKTTAKYILKDMVCIGLASIFWNGGEKRR
jgi:hypothetical protein